MKTFLLALFACAALAGTSVSASSSEQSDEFTKVYNTFKTICSDNLGCDTAEHATNFIVIFNYNNTSNVRTIAQSRFENILVNLGKSSRDSVSLSQLYNVENAQVLSVYDSNSKLNASLVYLPNGNLMLVYADSTADTWVWTFYYNR